MAARVFVSYSHRDEALYDRLAKHLKPLEYEGVIEPWYDRQISAGAEFDKEISTELESAEIILLLVSSDYLASDYCWGKELKRSMERHGEGSAQVVPVILRPVEWRGSPFGKLLALPKDGKPVTSWSDADEAFLNVTRSIRNLAMKMDLRKARADAPPPIVESSQNEPGVSVAAAAPAPVPPPVVAARDVTASPGAVARETPGQSMFYLTFVKQGFLKDPSAFQKFEVLLDGHKIAEIHRGETIHFRAVPGEHSVQLQRYWSKSKVLTFSTSPNEQITLECMLKLADSSANWSDRALGAYGIGEGITLRRIS